MTHFQEWFWEMRRTEHPNILVLVGKKPVREGEDFPPDIRVYGNEMDLQRLLNLFQQTNYPGEGKSWVYVL